jgi:hypothetical protein
MKRTLVLLLACSVFWAISSGAEDNTDFESLIGASGVYTLVNLHPDEAHSKLYAVNYLQDGLIPLCSKVQLLSLSRKRLTFRVEKTGREYSYDYHKAAAEPFPQHLARFFGTRCNSDKVARLGQKDQNGIKSGTVSPGMTKQGVIYAIGYPPRHVTPDLDATRWKYWKNRFATMVVVFNDAGVVTQVVQ